MDYIGFGLIIFGGTLVKQPLAHAMISRRSIPVLALGLIAASVTRLPAFAQQTRPGSKDFDSFWAEFGGYAGIIRDELKSNEPKILAFVKREGEKFIAAGDPKKREDRIEDFGARLGELLSRAKGGRASKSTSEFFQANAPQLLIEFIPYDRDYPNIAELGRYVQTKRRAREEATRRGEEAMRRANEEAEKTRRLKTIADTLRSTNGAKPQ